MALIRKEDRDIDYNIFSRLGAQLRPIYLGKLGAAEIGRLDFIKRAGYELDEDDDARKPTIRAGAGYTYGKLQEVYTSAVWRASAAG